MGGVVQHVRGLVQKTSTENGVLNFWTLRFVDPQLEDLFKAENEKDLRRKRIEAGILSGILLTSAAYLAFTGPNIMGIQKLPFYVCMFFWTLCGNVLLHFRKWQRHAHVVFAVFSTGCSVFLIVEMMVVIDSPSRNRDYQSGFASLVIFMMFSIIRVTYYLAIISSVFIWVSQLVIAIIVGHATGFTWYNIIGFTLGIASSIMIAGCAGYFIELKHRSVLLHKQILSEESERLQLSCNRFDKLLRNIFPKKIVTALKKAQPKFVQGFSMQQLHVLDKMGSGQTILNHHYPCVSVLLVDIVGFTPLSSIVAPRTMVSILNNIFSCFDDILEEHSLEKVRTIGDAYLCVGNMTKSLENHQEMAIRAGWQMLHNIDMLPSIKGIKINLRIGISCGPISAGVVGTTKWNYDIFGPTYSEATSAEGASIPGHITVTAPVYNALKNSTEFTFEPAESNSGVDRYTVVSSLASKIPHREDEECELSCPSFTPRARLSPLQILLPADFNLEEGELEITVGSDVSSSSCPASALATPTSPAGSPITNPFSSTSTSPSLSSPSSSPPYLALSSSGLRNRSNDFESRDFDMMNSREGANNDNFEKLRASDFFTELMRKHGVSSIVQCEYSMGGRRHNAERELLEKQEQRINRGVLYMRFSSPVLEEEFWSHFLRNAQKHMSTLSFCLTGAIILWIAGDLLSSPLSPDIPLPVFYNYGFAAIASCAFAFYIKSELYHHWTSKWISMLMMFVIGTPISLVVYFDHVTIYHFFHMYFFLCICFLYTRVWVVQSIIPVAAMTVVSVYLSFAYLPNRTFIVYLRNVVAAFFCCVIMAIVNFIAYVGLEKSLRTEFLMTKLIQNEFDLHQRANEATKMLVRNILPYEIATRLCAGHKVSIVDHIPMATIIFIGIPNLYSSSAPADVFYLLNEIYTVFDEITLTLGLEKIKAVGSTYMVASGVPKYRSDHMIEAIHLSKTIMRRMARDFKSTYLNKMLDIRVGIASGDVVAAIVGKRKYTYDCWSDCVNTAARMESHGVVGKIQVTENIYAALNKDLNFSDRGEIFVKGKGMMRTYLLDPYEGG